MTSIRQKESVSKLNHAYSTSWNLRSIKSLGSKSIKTLAFSPVPNSDVAFYFEIWYQENGSSDERISYFKMVFGKSSGINVPHSIKMDITVSIFSFDDLLKKYEHSNVSVNEMDSITISSDIFKHYVYDRETENPRFGNYEWLIIKSNLIFYEHLASPDDYFKDKKSLTNLKEFVSDFGCLYQPSVLSDIEFKIGDESLPAHKAILAAHSPVFQRMICNDFLESKTNIVSINDTSPEIFKSFLKYLYCGEIEDKTWLAVKELFRLADKYDVRSLKRECSEATASVLAVDNACEILKMAYAYGDEYLKQEANVFTVEHILEIAPKVDWKELVDSNPVIGYNVMKNFVPKIPLISPTELNAPIELEELIKYN